MQAEHIELLQGRLEGEGAGRPLSQVPAEGAIGITCSQSCTHARTLSEGDRTREAGISNKITPDKLIKQLKKIKKMNSIK